MRPSADRSVAHHARAHMQYVAGIFTYNASCFVFVPLLHEQETHTDTHTHMRLYKQETHTRTRMRIHGFTRTHLYKLILLWFLCAIYFPTTIVVLTGMLRLRVALVDG